MYEDLINPGAPKYGYVPGPGGVSFAAPAVSGMAGLVQAWIYWATDPPADRNVIVRGKLKDCCDDVNWQQYPGWDEYLGWGRVNLDKLADDLYGGAGDAGAGVPSTAKPLNVTAAVAPNPAHNAAKFAITLPAGTPGTEVELTIYDLAGRKIASKAVACSGEGRLDIDWDCRSSSGTAVAPGVYIYRVRAAESAVAGKVVIAE
jgi:subtilisin family serine protease